MAVPSENFNAPAANEANVDKPVSSSWGQKLRESLIHLEEWLGKNFVAAVDHDHDGVNSKVILLPGAVMILEVDVISSPFQEPDGQAASVGRVSMRRYITAPLSEIFLNPVGLAFCWPHIFEYL